ncbi:tRNA (guanine-N(7)-)-methyltransferase [Desulfuromonas versatilis]|uniref:tRNA (guanine-N(7)-)-methyltransferase n=1 Tax=Desulfuromonas versatilis TaxID=2802975 RepID=A0ABN6E1C9_9BACT|nr:tRNA (guanosine(46)-N7)-methyltransferase TrmB [Desulfuromonas versatilis]BCR06120.1 tRNA (guanine-N(7)-)-methyltransferase [Desulfuromonas versatilis]
MTQRMLEITSPNFIPEERLAEIDDLRTLFGNDRPLVLEIGCGIGDFIAQLAAGDPGRNYLAIDIYNKGCLKTCRRIDEAGLQNVRVLRMEARFLLARHLRAETLSAVYINCPDPWPKKRHRGRRLVNREFLQTLLYYLVPEGNLFFCTDFVDYAEDVAALLPTLEGYRNVLAEPFALELAGYPHSKYMRRFLELGQPIHFVHHRKAPGFRADESLLPPVTQGFRVRWQQVENG